MNICFVSSKEGPDYWPFYCLHLVERKKKKATCQKEIQDQHSLIDLSSLQGLQIASAFLFSSNTWRKIPCSVEDCVNNNSQNVSFKTRRINFSLHICQKLIGSQLSRYTFYYRKSSTNVKLLSLYVIHCTHNFPMAYTYGTSIYYIDLCFHRGINTEFCCAIPVLQP